jgi:Protein ChrB, N-terminal
MIQLLLRHLAVIRYAGNWWRHKNAALLLIHQLPSKPAYIRVKLWRRLQQIGAVAVKSSVYALPASADTQEDFEWLLKEIIEGNGEAMICEARLIDGLSDGQMRALFDAARDAAYDGLAKTPRRCGPPLLRRMHPAPSFERSSAGFASGVPRQWRSTSSGRMAANPSKVF